jgi:DNA-binding NtrC family response regulator
MKTENKWKILVVDDEAEILSMITAKLNRSGFLAQSAGGVTQAKQMLDKNTFDLILCDYRMPDGNGSDVLKYAGLKTPLLFVSGFTDITLEEAKAQGALDLLHKPMNFNSLIEKINSVFKELKPSTKAGSRAQ